MRFPLDGSPGHEEIALVPDIFFCDSFGNGLSTFELRAAIEVPAVLAGPQIRATFRASAAQADFDRGRDDGSAHGTPQNLLKTRHIHRPGTVPLLAFRGAGFRLLGTHHSFAAGVLISALSIFSF
jgi:hypothetical protein